MLTDQNIVIKKKSPSRELVVKKRLLCKVGVQARDCLGSQASRVVERSIESSDGQTVDRVIGFALVY